MLKKMVLAGMVAAALGLSSHAGAEEATSWVERSNEIAYGVLESQAKFAPEFSSQTGVSGFDEEIFDLGENLTQRQIASSQANIEHLEKLLASESDPRIRQDIDKNDDACKQQQLQQRLYLWTSFHFDKNSNSINPIWPINPNVSIGLTKRRLSKIGSIESIDHAGAWGLLIW